MPICRLAVLLLSLVCLVPGASGAIDPRWARFGPFSAEVSQFEFDPSDPAIVYAATTGGGFRSVDGGRSWRAIADLRGIEIHRVRVAPSDARIVYAATQSGLYRSEDRGLTWTLRGVTTWALAIHPAFPDTIYYAMGYGQARSSDGGLTFEVVSEDLPTFNDIRIDVQVPTTMTATAYGAGVFKSIDEGKTWKPLTQGLPPGASIDTIAQDPGTGTLYLGGFGLFRSTDRGETWTSVPEFASTRVHSIAISADPTIPMFAGASTGMFRSLDRGATWTNDPSRLEAVVAIAPGAAGTVLIESGGVVSRSTDKGATFSAATDGLTSLFTLTIAVDPRNEKNVLAGGHGIFRSRDGGLTWTAHTPSSGLSSGAGVQSLVFDPENSDTVYAVAVGSVWRSLDGGQTFSLFNTGLQSAVRQFVVDPRTPAIFYAAGSQGFYRKEGEAAWSKTGTGLPASLDVAFLQIDSRTPAILYLGVVSGAVYRTTDGGTTWTQLPGTGPSAGLYGFAIDPFASSHLFLSTAREVLESNDGGATWTPITTFSDRARIAFDPSGPGRLWAFNRPTSDILHSYDGGKTWKPVQTDGRVAQEILVPSANGTYVFAGGRDSGVWRLTLGKTRSVRP
jgi:photosystem II stability/assembly factor-like uncharacterized protein